jgi:hypothetical protein
MDGALAWALDTPRQGFLWSAHHGDERSQRRGSVALDVCSLLDDAGGKKQAGTLLMANRASRMPAQHAVK